MAENQEKPKKVKISTAIKRMKQNVKKQWQNKVFKSKTRTAIKKLSDHVSEKQTEHLSSDLNQIYSLIDKGVRRGIYKLNKAKRMKAHYTSFMTKHESA